MGAFRGQGDDGFLVAVLLVEERATALAYARARRESARSRALRKADDNAEGLGTLIHADQR
jgi:hypothetical protein